MYMLVIALMFGFNAVAQNNPDNPCPGEEPQCDNSGTEFKVAGDSDGEVEGDVESGGGDCSPGGLANTGCPYWIIIYKTEASFTGPNVSITCRTGGEFKCKE